jgi:hypothetical protein
MRQPLFSSLATVFLLSLSGMAFPLTTSAQIGELVFRSGFENDTSGGGAQALFDITGIDNSVAPPNSWQDDLVAYGGFSMQYVCGDATQRGAQIVDDPTGAINPATRQTNRVLLFWLKEVPLCNAHARVQDLLISPNFWEMTQRVRMFIHPDILILQQYPGEVDWLMFQEAWSTNYRGGSWGRGQNFRISFDINKASDSEGLYWRVSGNQCCSPGKEFWSAINKTIPIPINQWFTAETYFKAGDQNTGRVKFTVQVPGQQKEVVFDITDWTTHPEDARRSPLQYWMPHKLYSRDVFVDFVRNEGGVLRIFWDDWRVWIGGAPMF